MRTGWSSTENGGTFAGLKNNPLAVGVLVSVSLSVVFLAIFWDVNSPLDEMLLVGIPIAVAIGAVVGLAVAGRTLPRKKRTTIGLLMLLAFFAYVVVLNIYLASRV